MRTAAKRSIPRGARKEYIPCWDSSKAALYKEATQANDYAKRRRAGEKLLAELSKDREQRWIDTVEKTDFTRSSRKAFQLMRKLNNRHQTKTVNTVNANEYATMLANVSRIPRTEPALKHEIRAHMKSFREEKKENISLSGKIQTQEVIDAIREIKQNKQPGLDQMFPEFLKNLGPNALSWLTEFLQRCFNLRCIPKIWRKAKIIPVLKPKKDPVDVRSYRPISLLSLGYKLYERVVMKRISPFVECALPDEQFGFRPHRSTELQVLNITQEIEDAFQAKSSVGAVFVDLSSAYDTVWITGLTYKLTKMIPDVHVIQVIQDLISNRSFRVHTGNTKSTWRRVRNGLPQGSVLAPILFNCYTYDTPSSRCSKYMYADDSALLARGKTTIAVQADLQADANALADYYRKWKLRLNPSKCVSVLFNLGPRKPDLVIILNGEKVPAESSFKYLGVELDRSLTYNQHCTNTAEKLQKRVNLIRMLAGKSWGTKPRSLRISSLALVQSVADYACSVWHNSAHAPKVDRKMFQAMRIVSGTPMNTKTDFLPLVSNMENPRKRRDSIVDARARTCQNSNIKLLNHLVDDTRRRSRLKSRIQFPAKKPQTVLQQLNEEIPVDFNKASDKLPRRSWCRLNRLRTSALKSNWNNTTCVCGLSRPSSQHIVEECPLTYLPGGMGELCHLTETAIDWLEELNLDI